MPHVTAILGNEVGVQHQGVYDASIMTGTPVVSGLIVGKFKRGRFDKPMTITAQNIRAILGFDPSNADYIAVADALSAGVPSVQVLRLQSSGENIPVDPTDPTEPTDPEEMQPFTVRVAPETLQLMSFGEIKVTSPTLGDIPVTQVSEGAITLWTTNYEISDGQEHIVHIEGATSETPIPTLNLGGSVVEVLNWSSAGHLGTTMQGEKQPELQEFGYYLRKVPNHLHPSIESIGWWFKQNEVFNDPAICDWDVSNVKSMRQTFAFSEVFNQDLSRWNVRNVIDMNDMFYGSLGFTNASLKNWCVPQFLSKPSDFNGNGSTLPEANLPVWGTCPNFD